MAEAGKLGRALNLLGRSTLKQYEMDARTVKSNGKPTFDEALKAAYPSLFRAAIVFLGNRADAEDAVQETALRAYRAYGSFRGESTPTTWMYRILAGVAAEPKRRRRTPADFDEAAHVAEHRGRRPDETAEERDESRAVLRVLGGLPERQREIVTLFYLEGLKYDEVAKALGVSVGTVKSTLSRAREAIRAALDARGDARKATNELPK